MAISFTEQTGTANPFSGINVGLSSAPTFADIDGDGDLDLVVGENDGNLNYYENTGTASSPTYTARTGTANPWDGIDVGSRSTPTFADIDGDGDLDLVVGEGFGNLRITMRTRARLRTPTYTARTGTANPWNGIDVGTTSTPTFADIDGDGDQDLVVGEFDGNLNYYENTGTASSPTYTARTGTANPFNGIDVGSASTPTFADIDGDGDLDLVVGEQLWHPELLREHGHGFGPRLHRAHRHREPVERHRCGDCAPPRHLRILTATAMIRTSSSGNATAT